MGAYSTTYCHTLLMGAFIIMVSVTLFVYWCFENKSAEKMTRRMPMMLELSVLFLRRNITLPMKAPETMHPKITGLTMMRQMMPSLRKMALISMAMRVFSNDQVTYRMFLKPRSFQK